MSPYIAALIAPLIAALAIALSAHTYVAHRRTMRAARKLAAQNLALLQAIRDASNVAQDFGPWDGWVMLTEAVGRIAE